MSPRLRLIAVLVGVLALAATVLATRARSTPVTAVVASTPADPARVVGPGRIEPVSEEINIGVEVGGRVTRIEVEEGDTVRAGQILAALESRDYRAAVASAAARLAEARAALLRVRNGARQDERREASAAVAQADAVLAQA